jgi:hypothetical protein
LFLRFAQLELAKFELEQRTTWTRSAGLNL